MSSLRSSRSFHGQFISVRALSVLERRSFPASLRDMTLGKEVLTFSGTIESGDVGCNWSLVLWRNGFWTASAVFHDSGDIAGDFFFLELLLDHTQPVGIRLEGSILNPTGDRNLNLSQSGIDEWIRDNWYLLGHGPTVRLHAAPAIAALVGKTVGIVLLAIVVAVVVLAGGTFASKNVKAERCPEQSPAEIDPATGKPFPCVQFSTVTQ